MTANNCTSIATLPSVAAIEKALSRPFVTLPLYCLCFIRQAGWGFGFLLVTDFTDHYRSSVFNNTIPSKIPDTFIVGNTKIDRSKIFSISVPTNKVNSCWMELKKFSPKMADYDYHNYETSCFPQEGVIALVNFSVNSHKQSVEGFLFNISVCNRKMLLAPSNKANVKEKGFRDFMVRFSRYITPALYDTLLPNFPVDRYITKARMGPPKVPKNADVITQPPPLHPPPRKVRKLAGAQVVYQQQFSQAETIGTGSTAERTELQGELGSHSVSSDLRRSGNRNDEYRDNEHRNRDDDFDHNQSLDQRGDDYTSEHQSSEQRASSKDVVESRAAKINERERDNSWDDQPRETSLRNQGLNKEQSENNARQLENGQLIEAGSLLPSRQRSLEPSSSWERHVSNNVEFSTFSLIPCHGVRPGTVFTTKCKFHGMRPDPRHIMVKPYRRTLKIPSLTLYLSLDEDMVRMELHSDAEKCLFLGIGEVEDAINNISKITEHLQRLTGNIVDVSIVNKTMALDFDYVRLYWCPVSTLDQMSKTIE